MSTGYGFTGPMTARGSVFAAKAAGVSSVTGYASWQSSNFAQMLLFFVRLIG